MCLLFLHRNMNLLISDRVDVRVTMTDYESWTLTLLNVHLSLLLTC